VAGLSSCSGDIIFHFMSNNVITSLNCSHHIMNSPHKMSHEIITAVSVKWQLNGTAGGVYLLCVGNYCDFLSWTHFVTSIACEVTTEHSH